MTVKLNLTINEKIAARSKRYAAKKGVSVSKLVQDYLDRLTEEKRKEKKSFVEKYAGIIKRNIPDIDAVRDEYLKKKYGV